MRIFAILGLAAYAVAGSHARAADNPEGPPILIELFTSEGCSSCPPADALLQKMDGARLASGAQLIVLSEHVDYWNHDGWKDPYSSSSLTARQSAYARVLGISDVYTPQMIADGTAELHLNNPRQMDQILQKAAAAPSIPIHVDSVTVESSNPPVLRARIETAADPKKHHAQVYVAVALNHAESQVLHGENGGRHLTHVAVVQYLKKVGNLEANKSLTQDFQVTLKSGTDPANIRVIAFIQESGLGKVLGAALEKPPFK